MLSGLLGSTSLRYIQYISQKWQSGRFAQYTVVVNQNLGKESPAESIHHKYLRHPNLKNKFEETPKKRHQNETRQSYISL